jgi:serine/threonine protein kinase
VSCDLLLDQLHSLVRKKKDHHNLKLLRIDSDLSCDDLVDGGVLNVYVAQAIVESLALERSWKTNPSSRPSTSPYSCEGRPIAIDETIREGRVLRGSVSFLGKRVAVIVKLHQTAADSAKESSILNRLKGSLSSLPHAPDLLDSGHTLGAQPRPYLVLESFGLPLSHCFSTPSSTPYRLEIGTQLLVALLWLHQQDIVHCDLTPGNVLVEDGRGGIARVKLCDFDSATAVGDEFPSGQGPAGGTVLKFTKEWVSPEVYSSNGSSLRASKSMDVFPLGLMLACLFSRERSAGMTMLPEDEALFHVALTEPGPLSERISCDCFPTDSCRECVRSLCVLDPASRGSLSGALSGLEKLRNTRLQIENANLGRVNSVQGQVIEGIGERLDNSFSELLEGVARKDELRGAGGR